MTEIAEAVREGTSSPDANAESNPQSAQRVKSVPPIATLPSQAVTERVRALLRSPARIGELLDRPGSLMHAHPPTFARARELHHERAGRHNLWPPLRITRLVWGYFHLIVIKPALNFAEWVTETPLRLCGAVILALVVWHWS